MRRSGWVVLSVALAACSAPKPEANNAVAAPTDSVEVSRPARKQPTPAEPKPAPGHPCNIQDGEPITHKLKALGTEPFWAAEVDGRCVTYKTPEDQKGIRIWTRVVSSPDSLTFNGGLNGRQFQLHVAPAPLPACSDGMSDKSYPLEAVLRVDGETRKGCAEKL